jgi:hypothetical protein
LIRATHVAISFIHRHNLSNQSTEKENIHSREAMFPPNSENLLVYVNIDFPDTVPNVEPVKPHFDRGVPGTERKRGKKKEKPKLPFKYFQEQLFSESKD